MRPPTTPWRLLLVPPRSGAENMARDTGLMDRARATGEAVFAVYAWERPTLSLGRNQAAAGRYDLDEVARRSIDVVRRPTGGRALLHHREVTYSVTIPLAQAGSLADEYARINAVLLDALRALGVEALESRGERPSLRPGDLPCFAAPAEGELTVNGAKLVGSAQVREKGAMLQHGSILIEDDQEVVGALLRKGKGNALSAPAATMASALGRVPSLDEVAGALFGSVRRREDPRASPIDETETSDYTARHLEHYRSEWWTWRI